MHRSPPRTPSELNGADTGSPPWEMRTSMSNSGHITGLILLSLCRLNGCERLGSGLFEQ